MDWNLAIELAALVLAGVLMVFVVPWLREKIGAEKLSSIWDYVVMGVEAAEQLFGPKTGKLKKQYVLDQLNLLGIEADNTVDMMIESAVHDLSPHDNVKE